MPPIRADHRCIRKSGSASVPEVEERAKQPRRSAPLTKRNSPSHSRTPSPNQQAPPSSTIATVHAATAYGHVGARRSPSSKAGGSTSRSVFPDSSGGGSNAILSGPREKRSADQTRKGYNLPHAHSQRGLGSKSPAFGPPHKVAATRSSSSSSGGAGAGASWGASSPTPAGGSGSRASSSPTPTPASVSSSARGHSSPTLSRVIDAAAAAAADGLQQATAATSSSSAVCASTPSSAAVMMTLASASTMAGGSGSAAGSGSGAAGLAAASRQPSPSRAEAREMTLLDRVFLEQPHEGRVDVEGDDLHVSNEIQRHLKTRVQSQQSQRMEATTQESSTASSSSAAAAAAAAAAILQQQQQQPLPISNVPAVVGSSGGGGGFLDHHAPDHLLAPAGVTPVSPSSGSGPVQGGQMDLDVGAGLSLGPMDYLLTGSDKGNTSSSRQGGVGVGGASNRDSSSPSRGGARSRSPPPALGPVPDIQMGEAGGDGNLREVVSGFDAMDLDDLDNVDRALALLNAKKQWIIAKQYAEAQQAQQAQQQQHRNNSAAVVPLQPPPPQSSYGGSSRTGGGGGGSGGPGGGSSSRARRSSGRSSSNRHGGESSPSTAGGRSEAFGVSGGGGSVRGGGGGFMSSPVSYTSGRGSRGQQGRPPPVPGHLSASTAAMRRSSPGSIASLAELDSYLEHHHRRLVEQVEGVVADDVEAEIEASRQQHRRNPRSHRSFGAGGGTRSHNGSCSSGSSVPRTVGAGVTTKCFFDSTLSADGYNDYNAGDDDDDSSDYRGQQQQQQQQQHQHRQHQRVVSSERSGSGNGNGNGDQRTSSSRGWDPPNQRGPGYKRDRDRVEADGGWGATLRGFRGGNNANRGGGKGDVDVDSSREGGSSAFMGVSGGTSQTSTSSPPPSIMSSDDVSVSSYGHPVTVLPGSPNNIHFNGRPPPSLAKIRLEAVRSPAVRRGSRSGAGAARSGRGGSGGGGGGGGGGGSGMHNGGPIFTSPDASKHVHELCSPRSAFTPRSASSVSSLASSRGRR